jgi:putative alpha-1,2-mannosidase
MSAWYLFGALGMYPAVPGTGQLLLHAPRFARVEIDLVGGRTLVIEAPHADPRKPQYVAGVTVDGVAHPQAWIDWSALRDGGTVAYALAAAPPVDGWGTSPADLPISPCATKVTTNPRSAP